MTQDDDNLDGHLQPADFRRRRAPVGLALELAFTLAEIHDELADLDPDDQDDAILAERAEVEAELVEILDHSLAEVIGPAERTAVNLHQQAHQHLADLDRVLAMLRDVAAAVEQIAALAGPGARVDYGADLVDAARADLDRVLLPLPIVELADPEDRRQQ